MALKLGNQFKLGLIISGLIFLILSALSASAAYVSQTIPTWGYDTTYRSLSSVSFHAFFLDNIDDATVSTNSFTFVFQGSTTQHNSTSFSRVNSKQYRTTYSGSALDDFHGTVEVYVKNTGIQDTSGTGITNEYGHVLYLALIDNKGPEVTFDNVPSAVGTNPFQITFRTDEDSSVNDASAFTVQNATITSSVKALGAREFFATVTPDGNGPVTLQVGSGLVKDNLNNQSAAISSMAVPLDVTAPAVTSFTVSSNNATPSLAKEGDEITVSITTDEDLSSEPLVNISNEWATVTGSGTSFTASITVSSSTLNGVASVSVSSIYDAAGNDGTPLYSTTDESSITIDKESPTPVLTPDLSTFTQSAPETISLAVNFGEPVTGFTAAEVVATNATVSDLDPASGDGTHFTLTVTPDGSDDVSLQILSGAAQDATGNLNVDSAQATITRTDDVLPTVSISGAPSSSNTDPFSVTFSISEVTKDFLIGDLVLSNAAASNFTEVNSTTFTAVITPDGGGDISISVPANAMVDRQGNSNAASATVTVTLDTTKPTVSSIQVDDSNPDDGSLSWIVTFSEGVTGPNSSNFSVEGTVGATVTVTPVNNVGSLNLTPRRIFAELFGVSSAHATSAYYTQYRVTVSGGNVASLTTEAVLVFGSSSGISDSAGQSLVSVTPTGTNESSISPDTEAPTLVQMVAPGSVTDAFSVTFVFSEAVTGFEANDISVSNGTASNVAAESESGGYATIFTAQITPTATGSVAIFVVEDAVADSAGNQNPQSQTLTVQYYEENGTRTRTSAVIRNFLVRRNANIIANQPDLSGRLVDRGGVGVTEKFSLSSNYTASDYQLNFAGSLTRLLSGAPVKSLSADEQADKKPRHNVWVMGSLATSKDGDDVQDFGAMHIGADYLFTPNLLAGALLQFDWADEKSSQNSTSASGHGWMAGPYIVYRMHQNAIFDGHIAYGQSDNKVSPYGSYTDSFKTTRFYSKAQITGDFQYGSWTVAPQLSLSYMREHQNAYADSNAINIHSQVVELGQLSFGPTFSNSFDLNDKVSITAKLGLKGLWNFRDTGLADISSGATSNSMNRNIDARVEAGFDLNFANGARLSSNGYYNGIGKSDQEAYGGSLKLELPF